MALSGALSSSRAPCPLHQIPVADPRIACTENSEEGPRVAARGGSVS